MSDLFQAQILLQVAKRDLATLSGMLNADAFAEESFGFFVQQAAEKLLKAWLSLLEQRYPFTHNLSILLQSLEDSGCDVDDYWELTDYITFAVQLRYEMLVSNDESIDREGAIAKIQALYNQVEAVLRSVEITKSTNSDSSEHES